jgi:hypothetical protein
MRRAATIELAPGGTLTIPITIAASTIATCRTGALYQPVDPLPRGIYELRIGESMLGRPVQGTLVVGP